MTSPYDYRRQGDYSQGPPYDPKVPASYIGRGESSIYTHPQIDTRNQNPPRDPGGAPNYYDKGNIPPYPPQSSGPTYNTYNPNPQPPGTPAFQTGGPVPPNPQYPVYPSSPNPSYPSDNRPQNPQKDYYPGPQTFDQPRPGPNYEFDRNKPAGPYNPSPFPDQNRPGPGNYNDHPTKLPENPYRRNDNQAERPGAYEPRAPAFNERQPVNNQMNQPRTEHFEAAEVRLSKYPYPKIMEDISVYIAKQGINVEADFIYFDRDRIGVVQKRDFISTVCGKWEIIKNGLATPDEIEVIADTFDFYRNSIVYYSELCKKFRSFEYRVGGADLNVKKLSPVWRDKTYRVLAEDILKFKVNTDQLFRRYDTTGSGVLRLVDFQTALKSIPTQLNPQEISALADEFDSRHDGMVSYPRFANVLEDFVSKKSTYEAVMTRLSKYCQDGNIDLELKIEKFDPRNLKALTKEDFLSILTQLKFTMNPIETNTFCEELPKTKDNLIDLRYMLQRLPKPKSPVNLTVIYDKIKNFIKTSRQTMTQVFAKFDKDGGGTLGPYEFTQALSTMGISDLTASEISLIIQDLDKDHDGSVSLTEFADKLSMSVDLLQTSVSHSFFRKINQFLKNRGQRLQDFFRQYDYDHNNSLSKPEFAKMIANMQINLKEVDIESLYSELDANRDGRVTFMEFQTKYEKSLAIIEKRDELNKTKFLRSFKNKHPKDLFKSKYDPEKGSEVFLPEDLRQGVKLLGLDFTEMDIEHLVESMLDGKNRVDLDELLVFFGEKPSARKKVQGAQKVQEGPHWAEKWMKQVREYSNRQGMPIAAFVESYNSDRSGRLTMAELSLLLKDSTFNMTNEEQLRLGNELRKENWIPVQDLLKLIDSSVSPIEDLIETLKSYFTRTKKKLQDIFRIEKNGDIYRPEFYEGICIITPNIEIKKVMDFMIYLNPDIKKLNIQKPELQKISSLTLSNTLGLKVETERFISPRLIESQILKGIYEKIAQGVSSKRLNIEQILRSTYDKYDTNKISREQLSKLIDDITDRGVTSQNLRILLDDLDKNESGVVNYPPFVGRVQDSIVFNSLVLRFYPKILREVNQKNLNLNLLFKDSVKFVSYQELLDSLMKMGVSVDREELRKVITGLENDELGKVKWQEFVNKVYEGSERNVDEARDRPGYRNEPPAYKQEPYKNDPPSFRGEDPSYKKTPAYKNEPPVYRIEEPGYRNDPPAYRKEEPGYRNDPPPFRKEDPGKRNDPPAYRNEGPSYRNDPPNYLNEPPNYRDNYAYKPEPERRDAGFYNRQNEDHRPHTRDDPGYSSINRHSPYSTHNSNLDYPREGNFYSTTQDHRPPSQSFGRNETPYRGNSGNFASSRYPTEENRSTSRSGFFSPRNPKPLRGPKQHWARSYIETIQTYAKQRQKTLKQLFKDFDIDNSNSLSTFEFAKALQSMGANPTQPELQNLMEELDLNRDGRVSLLEFEKVVGNRENDERIEEKLEELREIIKRERIDLRRLFIAADRDRSNFLTYDEFEREIGSFYPRFSRYDLQDLAKYLDIDKDNRIFYHEFVGRMMVEEIEDLNAKLADFAKKNSIDIEEIFEQMDLRNDKCLHFDQYLEAFEQMRVPLSREDEVKIILENPLHRTRDNRFSYVDLLERLPLRDSLEKIYEVIRKTCEEKSIKANEIFKKYDVDNEEALTPKMFYEAFTALGGRVSSSDYSKIIESLSKTKDNKIIYSGFLKKLKSGKKAKNKKVVDLYMKLKKEIQKKNLNFLENLRSLDTYGDKLLARPSLKELFGSHGIVVSEDDLDVIWNDFDRSKSGLVNYEELCQRIKPKYKEPKNKPRVVEKREVHWGQRYLDSIQEFLRANNLRIKNLFIKYDKDHSNSVSASEFVEALRDINVFIPGKEMDRLINELISIKDGQISLSAFEKLFPEFLDREKRIDRQFFAIRRAVTEKRMDLHSVFSVKDQDYQGYLPVPTFLECIKTILPEISPQDLRLLADFLDPKRSNKIDYQDFIKQTEQGGIELVNIKVRDFLQSSKISFVKAFEGMLKDDYFLEPNKIRGVLDSLRLPLTPEEIAILIHDNNLTKGPEGKLSVKDLADRIGVRERFPEPRPSAAGIYERLKRKWQQQRIDPRNIFKDFDYEKDMHLTRSNFSQALNHGNCPLTNIEIEVIWENLEKTSDGRASVDHFIRLVNGMEASADPVFLKIYNFCEQNKVDLEILLTKYDSDKDRQISMFEMEQGLKSAKIFLQDREYSAVFEEVDRNRLGRIYIVDFVKRVQRDAPKVNLNELRWAAAIFNTMNQSLVEFKCDALTYFRKYNIDRDGFIALQDFRNAIYKLGIDPAANEAQRLVNYFKLPSKELVVYKDFEFALKNLGKPDMVAQERRNLPLDRVEGPNYRRETPFAAQPKGGLRVLTKVEIESLYQCLDYIALKVKERKVTVPVYVDKNFGPQIMFDEIKKMVRIDLKIEANESILEELCILLDSGKGTITKPRLIDGLSGVRILQILPNETQSQEFFRQERPEASYSTQQRSIMKPSASPIKLLSEFLIQNNLTLLQFLGRDSGTMPKSAFSKYVNDDRIMDETQLAELISQISQGDNVNLAKLSSLLPDLNRKSSKIDPFVLLKDMMRQKRLNFDSVFGSAPTLSRESFSKAVSGLGLNPEEINYIISECPCRNPAHIDLVTLNNRLEGRTVSVRFDPNLKVGESDRLLVILNSEMLRNEVSGEDLFEKFDSNKDGVLSLDEFIQAFESLRTSLSQQNLVIAFESLDVNRNKSLSINEICLRIPGFKGSYESRMSKLDLGQRFEEEVKQVFDLLDKDKDGSIDYNEVIMGIKAYTMQPSQAQIKEIISKIDRNGNGKIEYDEFQNFIESTIKLEIIKQEDEMQDLRQKFVLADTSKSGFLTPQQLFNVLRSINADITNDELEPLLRYADADKNGHIDIDEFMLVMMGQSPSVFDDPQASAVMFNIRKTRRLSPLDFFKCFSDMPKHFMPSFISELHKMRKVLPSSEIVPILDPSGLQFKDINPVASKSKLESLTYLKQNPVQFGGYLTLKMASGISIPDGAIVQRNFILKRFLKVTHFNSLTQKYLGNSTCIEAQWKEQLEDEWTFEVPTDKEYNQIVCRIGPEADTSKIFLIFEFVIVFCKENSPVEMSCGFAKVPYSELGLRTNHKVIITGGCPENEQAINPDDIHTYRSGFRHVLKMTGLLRITSKLEFSIKPLAKSTLLEIAALESLPEYCVMNKQGLVIIRLYREYLAELFATRSGKNFTLPNTADPFLTQFPKVLDCYDTWTRLVSYFNSNEFTLVVSQNRSDANCLPQLIAIVNRLYLAMYSEEFEYDERQPTRFSFGIAKARDMLYEKRMNIISNSLNNKAEAGCNYKPFDIMEIASKNLINTDFLMSRKVRSISKKLAATHTTGFASSTTSGRRLSYRK